jgi:hypothetical protein
MILLLEQGAEMRSHSIILQHILKYDFWNRLSIRSFVAELTEEELLSTNVVTSKCYGNTAGAKRLAAKHATLLSHHNGIILQPLLHNGCSQRPTTRSDYLSYQNNNLLS